MAFWHKPQDKARRTMLLGLAWRIDRLYRARAGEAFPGFDEKISDEKIDRHLQGWTAAITARLGLPSGLSVQQVIDCAERQLPPMPDPWQKQDFSGNCLMRHLQMR
ncbi:MAG: hypothetical protein WEB60_08315 [Terrimicrobiaceae bacterium]